jgi:hypothetical protein
MEQAKLLIVGLALLLGEMYEIQILSESQSPTRQCAGPFLSELWRNCQRAHRHQAVQ